MLIHRPVKLLAYIVIALLSIPFVVRPQNIFDLYAPFDNDGYLITAAVLPVEEATERFQLYWPKSLLRWVVNHRDFDYTNKVPVRKLGEFYVLEMMLGALYKASDQKKPQEDIEFAHVLVERAVVDEGANVNYIGFGEFTALHQAVLWNNVRVARLLLANGADCHIRVQKKMGLVNAYEFMVNLRRFQEEGRVTLNEDYTEMEAVLLGHQCHTQ